VVDAPYTLKKVKELRVDALFGKKKHYNAADRIAKYNFKFSVFTILINLFLGSILFAYLSISLPLAMKWAGAFLSLIAAFLSSLQTFCNYPKIVEGHRSIASRFLEIAKECSRLEAYVLEGEMDLNALREKLERLAKDYDQVVKDAVAFPTNDNDYKKAKKGFNEGQEEYTHEELNY
jgi:hypothetical protein